ncbi:helix-turn-helix domain-containing protein [Streptomyces sp. NPDC001978]|uniref:helix-turn-helix domain-containing protein n=1 Tax=Streptomyces sp. NPDC001978 TaxID=3364627 RepID=UPI00368A874C
MAALTESQRLLRVETVAQLLDLARSTVYEEIRLGRLRTVRIGRRRLIPTEYVEEYVELLKREALADDAAQRPWLRAVREGVA